MNRPPIPWRMRKLPRVRGLPVPFFSVIDADGVAHFSTVDWPKMPLACRDRLCWICGGKLGRLLSFALYNYELSSFVTKEPGAHRSCHQFALKACPYLSDPGYPRVYELVEIGFPDFFALWETPGYEWLGEDLIRVGPPLRLSWWREGRRATNADFQEFYDVPDAAAARAKIRKKYGAVTGWLDPSADAP